MLMNSGQAQVEEEVQDAVVRVDDEPVSPQVQTPVPNSLLQPNELRLIGGQLGIADGDGLAEERDGTCPLM